MEIDLEIHKELIVDMPSWIPIKKPKGIGRNRP